MIKQDAHLDYLKMVIRLEKIVHHYMESLCDKHLNRTTRFYKYRFHNKALPQMPDAALYILTREIQDAIVIELCPPKAFTGKNLSGSLNLLDIRGKIQNIIDAYFNETEQADPRYKAFRSASIHNPDGTIYDLTAQIAVPQALQGLYLDAQQSPLRFGNMKPKQYQHPKTHETVATAIQFGVRHKGNWTSCLIYQKYEEVKAHGTLHLYSLAEQQIMKDTLRVEFRHRYQAAKELGLRDMKQLRSQNLQTVFQQHFDRLTDGTTTPNMPELTFDEEVLVNFWKQGQLQRWKDNKSRRTWFNYKKALKLKGLDITKPYAETHIITGFTKGA